MALAAVFAVRVCGSAMSASDFVTPEPAAYFWHRVRNDKTHAAIKEFSSWRIYALAAEYRRNSAPVFLKHIDGTVPVIRLDIHSWQRTDFAGELARRLGTFPAGEIQLDCDVPESKLSAYAEFLRALRQKSPAHSFSITILPCHLNNRALKKVLSQAQYAVLQLHALEAPEKLPAKYRIFDLKYAQSSINIMRKMQVPFKIALPSYAYMVHYRSDGSFRRLSAEATPPVQSGEIRKLAIPDWSEVIALRKANADLPVIWFRLPQPGDRMALEAENLKRLNSNELPRSEAEVFYKQYRITTQIYWRNHGLLGYPVFSQELGGSGEAFFFNSVKPCEENTPFGQVPEKVSGVLPAPGAEILIGEIIRWQKKH